MTNKLIYWVPVVGLFVSLIRFDKDNGMSTFWTYYQAVVTMLSIFVITYFSMGS